MQWGLAGAIDLPLAGLGFFSGGLVGGVGFCQRLPLAHGGWIAERSVSCWRFFFVRVPGNWLRDCRLQSSRKRATTEGRGRDCQPHLKKIRTGETLLLPPSG